MWRNYFVIALRNLLKNKGATLISVSGLSIAIASCIIIYLFVDQRSSMDRFHPGADRIFLVESIVDENGLAETWCATPRPMGPTLKADFPQVESYVRLNNGGATFQNGDRIFEENFWYVDSNYLDVFSFPLKYGQKDALHTEDGIVLSDETARKYFGAEDPIGKTLAVRSNDTLNQVFTVRAVVQPFTNLSSFRFNILIPYQHQKDIGRDLETWGKSTAATYVKLRAAVDAGTIRREINRYVEREMSAQTERNVKGYDLDNLLDLTGKQYQIKGSIFVGMHPISMVLLPISAILLLSLACFNYVNLSISQAGRRMKEIGVRKVLGGHRQQLIVQFLIENLIICSLALVVGIYLVKSVLLDQFNSFLVISSWTPLKMSITSDLDLWMFLVFILGLTAIASGTYPALYVASFQPTSIFRGRLEISGKGWLTRILLTLQFVMAFYAITYSIITIQNARFQAESNLGYQPRNLAVLRVKTAERYRILAERLKENPSIQEIATTRQPVGRFNWNALVEVNGENKHAYRYDVGPGYIETMGMKMVQGQSFDVKRPSEKNRSVIVNESFVRQAGWTDPIGRQIRTENETFTITGVVADFHYADFAQIIHPVIIRQASDDLTQFLTLRYSGREKAVLSYLETTWKQLFPDEPLDLFFQESHIESTMAGLYALIKISWFVAIVALLLSCLGLFGLAAQNITRRAREIGIRKALGSSSTAVIHLVNRPFIVMLLAAMVLSTPLSYFISTYYLDSLYVYHVNVGPGAYILANLLVFTTVAVSMITLIQRIVRLNPAEVLKMD